MSLHGQQQKQHYHDDPSSSELYVDFYKFRKKYPRDVLLIGMYKIAKGIQPIFVFVKKDDEEPEEEWYKTCFKATTTIPYHRLIRVKGCGFLSNLVSRVKDDPTRFSDLCSSTIQNGLCESECYRNRYAYYITQYDGDYITVVKGIDFLNDDDDSFGYLKSIINSLREYDTTGGGLTTRDIEYSPQLPMELIKRDENGVIVSGMESVIEAYYMREITLLGIFSCFGVDKKSTKEEEEEGKKKKNEEERILVCCITNEEKEEDTYDEVLHPMDWIIERVYADESDCLKIKCDDFIDSLLSSRKISFEEGLYIYRCTQNFEKINRVYICQCDPFPHQCYTIHKVLKKQISVRKKIHERQLKRKMEELERGDDDNDDDLRDKKRFKNEDEK